MSRTAAFASGDLRLSAYVGWPAHEGEAQAIAAVVDRVLVHAYTTSPRHTYGRAAERLRIFAGSPQRPVEVVPIVSAEDEFMGSWFDGHPFRLDLAEALFESKWAAEERDFRRGVRVIGFAYYEFGRMR